MSSGKAKRATRGLRMSALVGEALDEDNAFYSAEIWEEGNDSDNESFSEEEVKPDEFDDDFNDSEDDGSDDDEGEEDGKGGKAKKQRREVDLDGKAAKNVYKEPSQMRRKPVARIVKVEDNLGFFKIELQK